MLAQGLGNGRAFGPTIGDIVGAAAAPVVSTEGSESAFAITRLAGPAPVGRTARLPADDAWIIALQLAGTDIDLWAGGRRVDVENNTGAAIFLDLAEQPAAVLRGRFDSIHFYLPRQALEAAAICDEVRRPPSLRFPCAEVYSAKLQAIGRLLLPALNSPPYANQLFLDWVGAVFFDQLRAICGEDRGRGARTSGGLAGWQVRLACELIQENLDGELTVTAMARACGLSRSYFVRAFSISTGLPPHQWLLFARVERAKELLRKTRQPLAEVAQSCGFVDQSHFTRVFSQVTGHSPGRWQRVWHA